MNTAEDQRWLIWHDAIGLDDCRFARCAGAPSANQTAEKLVAPCSVRRKRVVSWPVPCSTRLPNGCGPKCGAPPLNPMSKPLIDRRSSAPGWLSGPWVRAHYGRNGEDTFRGLCYVLVGALVIVLVSTALSVLRVRHHTSSQRGHRVQFMMVTLVSWAMLASVGYHVLMHPAKTIVTHGSPPAWCANVETDAASMVNGQGAASLPVAVSSPAPVRPRRCRVRGTEKYRVAVCFYGKANNIMHSTLNQDGARGQGYLLTGVAKGLAFARNLRDATGAMDVFVHALLTTGSPQSKDSSAIDFLALQPCRFAAEEESLIDAERIGMLESTVTDGLRVDYSLLEVSKLVRAHERASGFKYTHVVAVRSDVAVLSPISFRLDQQWKDQYHVAVPNFGHNDGINDRIAHGVRKPM